MNDEARKQRFLALCEALSQGKTVHVMRVGSGGFIDLRASGEMQPAWLHMYEHPEEYRVAPEKTKVYVWTHEGERYHSQCPIKDHLTGASEYLGTLTYTDDQLEKEDE
jgi:hypothetical protein